MRMIGRKLAPVARDDSDEKKGDVVAE